MLVINCPERSRRLTNDNFTAYKILLHTNSYTVDLEVLVVCSYSTKMLLRGKKGNPLAFQIHDKYPKMFFSDTFYWKQSIRARIHIHVDDLSINWRQAHTCTCIFQILFFIQNVSSIK